MQGVTTIAARALLITGVFGLTVTAAYLKDVPLGFTFSTQGVNLKIDSTATYNGKNVPSATWAAKDLNPTADKFFNFNDIKPGDIGCNVISMHVQNTDAWMCLDFKNLKSLDNGVNEPESQVDANGTADGELAKGTQFFGWIDDGDGKYEPPTEKALFGTSTKAASSVLNDQTYVIGDSKGGNSCKPNTTKYVGMCWCAGTLTVNANGTMVCDGGALGNAAQTDSFTVDTTIRALPVTDNPKYLCMTDKPKTDHSHDHDNDKDDHKDDKKDWSGYHWNIPSKPQFSWGGINWYGHK